MMKAINSTKNIYRSSGSIVTAISSMRHLHIEAKHIINDQENTPSAIILQSTNDIIQTEEKTGYQSRSWGDLEKTFPPALSSKTLLIIKINQSVINSDDWKNKKMNPIYTGHVLAGVFRKTNRGLIHLPNTLVSKVPSGMESDANILQDQFFSSQSRYLKAKKKCSMEYYCVIDINKTVLDIESYQKRCLLLVEKTSQYDLAHNACGQAVFYALTGLKPLSQMSTQIAAVKSLFEIVQGKGDSIFYEGLRDAVIQSGLSKPADAIGRTLVSMKHQVNELSKSNHLN